MKKIILAGVLMFLATCQVLFAQHHDIPEKAEMYKGRKTDSTDTSLLMSAFKRGRVNGHFRYFFMATDNKDQLTDYYANAAGGGIRYETAKFHGLQFSLSGFYIFNIGSSDLTLADSTTGQFNRYETGLFDVQDPANKKDIDRLEEFYLKYNFKKSNVVAGRQTINTPFINLQDGRMRPTGVEGILLEINEIRNTKIEGGWIYAFSPRSTTKWFNPGESIGIYPTGLNLDGSKSAYGNAMDSKSAALLGITTSINNLKLQGWNLYVDNIFNTALLQGDFQIPLADKSSLYASAQLIRQDAVNNGGHEDISRSYFEKGAKAITFGTRAGWKNQQWDANINYNRITRHGRYLMPREWGRDPFFTFLPQERNEGFGDVQAVMAKVNYKIPRSGIKTSLAAGYYVLPDVKNFRLNKYGLPSYAQLNFDTRYVFSGVLKGIEAQFLVAGKINTGESYNNYNFEFNKVDMVQYNFVLNYHF